MFTGIVECTGKVISIAHNQSNIHFEIESPISSELKIDQSVSHNGVCLTVTQQNTHSHTVTAIAETLSKTDLGSWEAGTLVNLERCLKADGRFDGHIVQGHVDCTGKLVDMQNQDGSFMLSFEYPAEKGITVEKGSICVNGISLTVVNSHDQGFSVAIIPYTWEHTNLKNLQIGSSVNIEFDILGKYMQKIIHKKGA